MGHSDAGSLVAMPHSLSRTAVQILVVNDTIWTGRNSCISGGAGEQTAATLCLSTFPALFVVTNGRSDKAHCVLPQELFNTQVRTSRETSTNLQLRQEELLQVCGDRACAFGKHICKNGSMPKPLASTLSGSASKVPVRESRSKCPAQVLFRKSSEQLDHTASVLAAKCTAAGERCSCSSCCRDSSTQRACSNSLPCHGTTPHTLALETGFGFGRSCTLRYFH